MSLLPEKFVEDRINAIHRHMRHGNLADAALVDAYARGWLHAQADTNNGPYSSERVSRLIGKLRDAMLPRD